MVTPVFTADSAEFARLVLPARQFVPDRPAYPVLKGVLLTARDGEVEVRASDMHETGRATLPATVTDPGRVLLVNAALLARIARRLPGLDVAVGADGARMVITSGGVTYRLLTMPDEDYYPAEFPVADTLPLEEFKPAAPDGLERGLTAGEAFVRSVRPRKTTRAARIKTLYDPTDLNVGAWVTWTRTFTEGPSAQMRGQVWATAPGKRSVWALVEGEAAPVRVTEYTYGSGLFGADRKTYTVLEEEGKHPAEDAPGGLDAPGQASDPERGDSAEPIAA